MSASPRPPYRRTLRAAIPFAVLATSLAAACGGDGSSRKDVAADQPTGPTCTSADTTPVGLAVREYITTLTPFPQRYLNAAGTDSALPEDGFKMLQEKGPSYFYSSDPKAQQQIKDKLASVGPYASLLVVYKGKTEADSGNTVTVSLGGHYVGGQHDGKVAEVRAIIVQCDTAGWRVTNPKTPATKPAAPGDSAPKAPGGPA
ncbi:MAG: hypothetical protein IBJ03_07510 [Gemmatimonadaceae bacterium]|nr:hypothetical protein [Gemmatimonadaceae bacterium]